MGETSTIEWTDATFNPWWGCTRVSDECTHCYAEREAKRRNVQWGKNADRRMFGDTHWNDPLRWNRKAERTGTPLRVFCASMADVFEDRPELSEHRQRLWQLIEETPWLVWQLLTKRPENVLDMVPESWTQHCRICSGVGHLGPESTRDQRLYGTVCSTCDGSGRGGWPAHVWMGTTAGHQKSADERLPHLVRIPAPVRFVSVEPMLGPVDLRDFLADPLDSVHVKATGAVQWVVCGGESGPGARPMNPDWARSVRDQTIAAGVPFMFKQWGDWLPADVVDDEQFSGGRAFVDPRGGRSAAVIRERSRRPFEPARWRPMVPGDDLAGGVRMLSEDLVVVRVGKKTAGRVLDDRTYDGVPELLIPV